MDLNKERGFSPEIEQAVKDQYEYHPWDDTKKHDGEQVREALMRAAETIIGYVPPCPDRSTALRKLREAWMDCNSATT